MWIEAAGLESANEIQYAGYYKEKSCGMEMGTG